VAWPRPPPRDVGRLTVTEVAPRPGGACDPISFMILDQEPGIEMSDDRRSRPARGPPAPSPPPPPYAVFAEPCRTAKPRSSAVFIYFFFFFT
jgi:hypothetical protein